MPDKKNIFFLMSLLSNTPYLSSDNTTKYHTHLWANLQQYRGNISQAQNWYKKLFDSNNSVYTKGHLILLADTKQFKQITDLIPSLEKKFVNDPDVQLLFANALEKTNRILEADTHIIKLSQTFKTNSEVAFRATQTYIRRKEPENALLTIAGFLNNTPRRANNFVFYFLQSQIHVQLSQFSKALESIRTCVELHPYFDKGWLLCASLSEKEGHIKEALSGYTTFLEISGRNSEVEKHLFALTLKYKTTEENKQVFLTHTISIDNALLLFTQKRYDQALIHINKCIEEQPINNECKLLKLQILSSMKNFDQAAQSIISWSNIDTTSDIWPKSLCLLRHNGMPVTLIIETLNSITKQHPNNLWAHLYCADMCMRENKSDAAISCITNALPHLGNSNLHAKILYQLAMLHYEQGNHNTMLTNLEHAHSLDHNSAHINNALAYYWATKGKNTEKSRPFIEQALAADSSNPYFLDTHALILYKEKKYEQARLILEPLAEHNNGTILLHLAKVHYALNNKEIADTFTQKAHKVVKNNQEKKALNKMELLLAST